MVIYQTRLTSQLRHYSIETSVRLRSMLRRGVERTTEPIFSFRYFPFNSQRLMFYFTDVLTLRRLMSYIYGAAILDVSRSHTTTQHSR